MQLVMPTGSGKTGIIVLLPYFLNKRKVVAVAPKPDIAEQIAVQFVGPNFSGDNYPTRERDAFIFKVGIDPREEVRTSRILRTSVLPRGSMILRSSDAPQHFHDELMIFNAQRIRADHTTTTVDELPTEGVDLVIVDEASRHIARSRLSNSISACTWSQISSILRPFQVIESTAATMSISAGWFLQTTVTNRSKVGADSSRRQFSLPSKY